MKKTSKILVVDDEVGIRSLLHDVLTGEGFKVTLAQDGQESLDRMKKCHFDLLITDLNMPRMDGIELLRRMKKAGRRERVIVMTGRPMRYWFDKDEMPHVSAFLQKPFHMESFVNVVRDILETPTGKPHKIQAAGGL